jgi:hypothetical protein
MNKMVKFLLVGIGGAFGLVAVIIVVAIYLPEPPNSIEHHGVFDTYWYHYSNIGEPGRSRVEFRAERFCNLKC